MDTALIGHTGFVGSNLRAQQPFDETYNSSNIADIDGRSFSHVVCAGVSAVKWWANKNPEIDRERIEGLIAHLDTIDAEDFTLISTVDVYASATGRNEHDTPDTAQLHAYGANRVMLETWVARRFARHSIVRLPALFGTGLKKNALFDMMNDNMTEVINGASTFQWYPLERLSDDIATIRERRPGLVNLVTAPVATETIRARFFADKAIGSKAGAEAHYDLRTVHDTMFGGSDGYILGAADVLDAMQRFIEREQPQRIA